MKKNITLLLLLFPFLLIGCDKEMQDIDNIENVAVPLNITVGNYEEFDDTSSPETRSAETVQTFVQPLDSTKDTGIDIVTTVEMVPTEKTIQTRANMNNNSRFRMLIYNSAGNQVADNQYQVNGTTATLVTGTAPMLTPGTYKFVSYTNNLTALHNLGSVVNASNGDDFATYCVTKNISSTNNSITILFRRQMSQFQLAVSASGFNNNTATYNSATVSNLNSTGTWNVNNSSSDDPGLTVSGTGSITCANNTQYKLLPVSRTLSISLGNLNIGGTNYGTKTVSIPVAFIKRGNYKVTVQFTKPNDYIEIGGVKWAKGNLCNGQIATSQEMAGNGTPNSGYYYNWNSNNPFDYTTKYTSWSNQREPCPAGWRTPTDNEFEILIRSNHCLGTYKGVPGIYLGTTTQPSDQDRDNYVFLPRNGYRNIYGGIETDASMYWTSVLNPVVTNGQFTAYIAAIKVNEFRYMASAKINEGAFIRCVKSK